jgi:hypothetical protein
MFGVVTAGVPGAFLVESIPLLKYLPSWVPGAGFKKKAKQWRKEAIKMMEVPFAALQRDMVRSQRVHS